METVKSNVRNSFERINMSRYNDDDDDFQDENLFPDTDDDDYDGGVMDAAEYAEMMRRQEALQLMQLELVQLDLNQKLLFKAIKLVKENTWFFSFRSKEKQLKLIAMTYHFLKNMVVMQEGKNA